MISPDVINGAIETGGGLVILLLNIRLTHRQKQVRGVNPWATSFFSTWGLWNLYFYPALGQWWSFAGGAFLVAMNFIWFGQLLYYSRKEARETRYAAAPIQTENFRYDPETRILEAL
jgi:uncharacterized membrane protein YfcA